MKLLVTGGAGYVGSVCAAVLVEQGHDVTIIDNFSTGNREAVPETARVVEGDVADKA
ncbi:NAD-dependent epimerase/dehydratase family protein, partial [Corynebacterium sp.]